MLITLCHALSAIHLRLINCAFFHIPRMKVLVIRFRQMGDAVLATALLNSIRASFPDAEIHYVLNANLADLFRGHPAVDKVIPFSPSERHSPVKYLWRIFRLMVGERYDAVVDLRSTPNCLPFSIFAPFSKLRVGLDKRYTWPFFTHRIGKCGLHTDVVTHDLRFLEPFRKFGPVKPVRDFTLSITPEELEAYRQYLVGEGVDFSRPILLCGVATKLAFKCWPIERMLEVMTDVVDKHPRWQFIFNYVPGTDEETLSRQLFASLGSPSNIYINVRAESMRQLVALASLSTAYFGNEGGTRHIAQAVGIPSLVIVSPGVSAANWIIPNSIEALAVSSTPTSLATSTQVLHYLHPFLTRYTPSQSPS